MTKIDSKIPEGPVAEKWPPYSHNINLFYSVSDEKSTLRAHSAKNNCSINQIYGKLLR